MCNISFSLFYAVSQRFVEPVECIFIIQQVFGFHVLESLWEKLNVRASDEVYLYKYFKEKKDECLYFKEEVSPDGRVWELYTEPRVRLTQLLYIFMYISVYTFQYFEN